MRRTLVLLPALTLLAACDGGGGTGADSLDPAEVAGVYKLCTLRFQPGNPAFPVADLLTTVVDTTPPPGRPRPTIALATNGAYDLAYTEAGTAFLEQVRGSIGYHETSIALACPSEPPGLGAADAAAADADLRPGHGAAVRATRPDFRTRWRARTTPRRRGSAKRGCRAPSTA